jgi:hypothetical protein
MSEHKPPEDEFESHRAGPSDGPVVDRPDWLVGPDEGPAGEIQRDDASEAVPKLVRPGLPLSEREAPERKPEKPTAWTAAASSVPTLRRREEVLPSSPDPSIEPPVEQLEASRPGGPVTTSGSATAPPASPAESDSAPPSLAVDEFPMDDLPGAASEGAELRGVRATRTIAPLKEPWWAVALDTLRSNRILQAVIVLSAVAFIVWKMWPSPVPSLHIAKIHANPEGFDGQQVELHGKVGEVFPVGGGYAFYLHQGRDTIVVFTRSRVPVPREKISVLGSVSTGYLDGVARPALFEEAQ